MSSKLRLGVAGPGGSGKTALVEAICRRLRDQLQLAVVTNDIYTQEDAEFLTRVGALEPERIRGVETGGCPHTAIREDCSINRAAVEDLERNLENHRQILLQAPTGLGKTMGVLFPALKQSLSRGEQLFYVTPKNSQFAAVSDAVQLISAKSSKVRALLISAKTKI